ncbi:MAG: hypothetical protein RJB13_693 [Pseudomonadota bacterium]
MFTTARCFALIAAVTFAAGCVPGQYTTIPIPAGSKIKQQAADGDGAQNPNTDDPSQQAPGSNTTPPGGAPGTGTPAAGSGVTFGPGVPERDALRKCMNLWGTTPFKEVKADQVKVMDVSVGVGGGLLPGGLAGIGNIINIGNPRDLDVTSSPRLIVLPLSVNVGGATTFELMNPNGWYCMKAAVGARSTVNIKLHCSAKLAQSDLGVSLNTNPGSGTSGTPTLPVSVGINDGRTPGGQLGIMVDSNVSVVRVDSNGIANCP